MEHKGKGCKEKLLHFSLAFYQEPVCNCYGLQGRWMLTHSSYFLSIGTKLNCCIIIKRKKHIEQLRKLRKIRIASIIRIINIIRRIIPLILRIIALSNFNSPDYKKNHMILKMIKLSIFSST